ncbi:MAG: aldehyde dehydrogenase family protein [Brevundimonas sp.]|uniref:aldehyde dehydrogenase family protein n=1 Tax=Brevundimonas sp. TaxID=1871086 RepID=UPI00272492EF|nr:aldehyde dehydrogenase family protein [Brevundimonas sp.]MDO9586855.1 aldehyde dehydrogenase family protein [Brevundimonas sp.]
MDASSADPTCDRRVAAARAAFDEGRTRDHLWRSRQLAGLIRLIDAHEEDIVKALGRDLGKPRAEALTAEAWLVRAEARETSRSFRRWARPRSVRTPLSLFPGASRIVPEPRGVALIMGAWNYPFLLTLSPLIGALGAGCAAVVKPSEQAPATADLLAELLPRYLDPEAVQVVQGDADGAARLLEQRFDLILYTGGARVGRLVMAAAARHLTPVILELGGKSPALVHDSADIAEAARRIAWGKSLNAGQTCTAPDYVLAPRGRMDAFLEAYGAALARFHGDDAAASPDYGRILNRRHFDRLSAYLGDGRVVIGGRTDPANLFIEPTVLVEAPGDAPVMQEEIFGPILPLIPYDSWDEALAFVRARDKPLAAYAFGRDRDAIDRVERDISAGAFCGNDVILQQTVPDLPFGGVGASGMGAYHGRAGFDAFSHAKAVLRRPVRFDSGLRFPPHPEGKLRRLRSFF